MRELGVKPIVGADTAGSRRRGGAEGRQVGRRHRLVARRRDLRPAILRADIEDAEHNTTRFVVIAKEPVNPDPSTPVVTTFVFRVRNVPAALYKAMGGFATNGVNMTKLESYMLGGNFFATQFYADIEGHPDHLSVRLALEELGFFSREVRILGVYPKATDIVLLNYFLFCASIELGLKAAILSIGNSATAKEEMKRIGHDLVKAYARFRTSFPANDLLDANDQAALAKINPFFKKKGLEYITGDVVEALMNGLSAFPSETEILTAAQKVNSFLQEQDYFKNC
jgi:hypothetical protein